MSMQLALNARGARPFFLVISETSPAHDLDWDTGSDRYRCSNKVGAWQEEVYDRRFPSSD